MTVQEHAEAHHILFEKYGRWQDELAWKGLAGIIGHEEAVQRANVLSKKGKKFPHTAEWRAKITAANRKNKFRSEETRMRMRAAAAQIRGKTWIINVDTGKRQWI